MDGRRRENQELFPTGNERIGEVARGSGADGGAIPFLEDNGRFQIVRKEGS